MRLGILFLLLTIPHIEQGRAEIQPNGIAIVHFDTQFKEMPACKAVGGQVKSWSKESIELIGSPGSKVNYVCH